MKIKIGDLTVRQMAEICNSKANCEECPFGKDTEMSECRVAFFSTKTYLDFKIYLPDEEVKDNGEIH